MFAKPGPVWHLSGFAFSSGSVTHAGTLMVTVFLQAQLLIFPSIFPFHWPCEWINGVQTRGSDGPSGIVHAQISHHTFYICNCMLRFPLFLFPSHPVAPPSSSHDLHITERSSCYLPLYPSPHFSVKFVTLSSLWRAFVLAPSALSVAAINIGRLHHHWFAPHSFFFPLIFVKYVTIFKGPASKKMLKWRVRSESWLQEFMTFFVLRDMHHGIYDISTDLWHTAKQKLPGHLLVRLECWTTFLPSE